MFSPLRFCNNSVNPIYSRIYQLPLKNARNGKSLFNNYRSYTCLNCIKRPNLVQKIKPTSVFRYGAITSTLYKSTQNNKGKKSVGYWLLTCSGMVFVAVVLGSIISYSVVLQTIYKIIEEIIKFTVR